MGLVFKLAKKVKPGTELHEILLRLSNTYQGYDIQGKTGVFVTEDNFKDGNIRVNYRKANNDTVYHEAMGEKLAMLKAAILTAASETDVEVTKQWLVAFVENFHHQWEVREKGEAAASKKGKRAKKGKTTPDKDIFVVFEDYLKTKKLSDSSIKANKVMMRHLARYAGFIRATDRARRNYTFDIDTATRQDVEDFRIYLMEEKTLSEQYPELFEKLLEEFPVTLGKGQRKLCDRGHNAVIKLMKLLKTFFIWMKRAGITTNQPFDGVEIGSEVYGTPYYLTKEERDMLMNFDLSGDKRLETQRDIFVFQCMVGCRVGDLDKLTERNVNDGILFYTPGKTLESPTNAQARVPLMSKAKALIEKYRGVDRRGRLFPFVSHDKYNEAIKDVFTKVGLTRYVEILNPTTGQLEMRPLNEIISSHAGRRTFVGNAYLMVQDPNLIGKMSGHTDGSRAFARYRNIEDATLRSVIEKME